MFSLFILNIDVASNKKAPGFKSKLGQSKTKTKSLGIVLVYTYTVYTVYLYIYILYIKISHPPSVGGLLCSPGSSTGGLGT